MVRLVGEGCYLSLILLTLFKISTPFTTGTTIRDILDSRDARRTGGVANGILSTTNRPVVNTDILMGNSNANTIASVSKGFSMRTPINDALRMSFVNCGAIALGIAGTAACAIDLRSSSRTLSRIIIATVNVGGRHGTLKCSVRSIGSSRLVGVGATGPVSSLSKGITNIGIARSSNTTNTNTRVVLHKKASNTRNGSGRPLFIISNIVFSGSSSIINGSTFSNSVHSTSAASGHLVSVGPRSVRDVSILGNPTTTTLCNSHTTGKIVLVAAGGNGRNIIRIGVGSGFATS